MLASATCSRRWLVSHRPEEVLGLRPATQLQDRIEELLAKNRAGGLSAEEQREWERYEYIEHLVRLAKVRAIQRQAQR